MNKKKLKQIISLAIASAMLLGSASSVSAAPVSQISNIKNNTILIGEHIFELDKTRENVYNMDTFVKAVQTLGDNDTIYYKISDHWVALNEVHTANELLDAIKEVDKHEDSIVKDIQVKKVNGIFMLETSDNYSKPEEGTAKGTTKISSLKFDGIVGAEKWQIKVQDEAFDIPVQDSTIAGAEDYAAGTDIEISANQRLLLLATDDSGKVKGYVEIVVDQDAISAFDKEATIIDIKDAKLKEAINYTLDKDRDPAADITLAEMESIKKISGDDALRFIKDGEGEHTRGISNISGLEYAVNLESLDLSENRISDLTPLKNLTKLKYIEVDRNNIADLTPLENLKELEHLNIYNNAGIVDTTPISGLTKLNWIDMHYCNRRTAPVNVEPLGNLTNLVYLSIDDNFVEDISFTEKLVNLKTFSCNNNYVTDLSVIQDFAAECYNDWSGERFFNMFGQMLKEPVKVNAASKGTVYKMKTPVTGNERYVEKVENVAKEYGSEVQVPAVEVYSGDEDYISVNYNHDTDEIELNVKENTSGQERSSEYKIMLDYGMYSLKIDFDITQEAVSESAIIDIKDAKLKEVINHTLGEDRDPAADITMVDMESITEIRSDFLSFIKDNEGEAYRGINNISGLEYAVNLESLDLSENRISDLTPLKNLKKLTYIELDRNNLGDLTPLSGLTNLKHLNIYNNEGIVDITPITGLITLEWIDMHYCNRGKEAVDVVPLASLVNLEYLSIESNFVEDISFVKNLKNLKSFSCAANHVTDLSPVSDLSLVAYDEWDDDLFLNMFGQTLKNPTEINVGSEGKVFKMDTPVKGLDAYIEKMENMYGSQIPGISLTSDEENDYVTADYNHDTDQIEITMKENVNKTSRSLKCTLDLDYGWYTLRMPVNITQVGASEVSIIDIKDAKLKEVINHTLAEKLEEDRDPAADITMAEMESIKELSSEFLDFIEDSEGEHTRGISNISGLEYAVNLESLDLSENRISDLTPLKNLTKLNYIEVDRNDIAELAPLSNLKELEHLNIYNNAGIVDTTPISGLTKLKWIDMHYCNRRTAPVNVEPLGNLTNLEYLSIDDNFVDDISFTEKLVNLKTFSCNNNYVTDLSVIQDFAAECYNDWSGERFFNMYGQMLKESVKVNAASEGTVYKMKTPVTGNERYVEKVESVAKEYGSDVQVPAVKVLSGDENYISASYNHDTDEIELSIEANTSKEERSSEYKIMLDYGMYSLKIDFDITQEGLSESTTSSAITLDSMESVKDESEEPQTPQNHAEQSDIPLNSEMNKVEKFIKEDE